MNWIHFSLWVAGIYILYYLVMLMIDMAGTESSPNSNGANNELTFSESTAPKILRHEPDKVKPKKAGVAHASLKITPEPEVIASGGLSLKDLFTQSRLDTIIYTRAVSFS
ncbi:hypothetical protein HDF18_13280 [Mucilaginibacter sp. X5P1]|uniref:hypothetical protein n=1 Tax=Mucilaginibacter sp. X5P1 TaxID=2723088 RepID=UPI00161CAA98|nr:hypothetical protein [Mucilaginibacter sp. X5P1]MBB6141686.1 hypothetical protein [Mucilaginibacter sp. X5P1]